MAAFGAVKMNGWIESDGKTVKYSSCHHRQKTGNKVFHTMNNLFFNGNVLADIDFAVNLLWTGR